MGFNGLSASLITLFLCLMLDISSTSVFFLPHEKECYPWKLFLIFFLHFFTDNFCFSRAIICRVLSFFSGKKSSFMGKNLIFFRFHGQLSFYTGNIVLSRAIFRGFFTGKVLAFSEEKKYCPQAVVIKIQLKWSNFKNTKFKIVNP